VIENTKAAAHVVIGRKIRMPRALDNKTPRKNATEERLRATPFNSVDELDREAKAIRLTVWRRFAEAQIIDELVTKPENKALLEEWKAGLNCFFGTDLNNNFYKIFSEGKGLKLQLNREFTKSLNEAEVRLLEGVVRAGIEGYGALYMRSKSLIQNPPIESSNISGKPKAKAKHG